MYKCTIPLRLVIVSTPRSGNTWLRKLLQQCYNVPDNATHELSSDDWARMPREVVHQIHWPRTKNFLSQLLDHRFKVITIARHPFDTLISILHYSWYYTATKDWLLGQDGDESGIRGAMPRSRAFIEYAKSKRAASLLSITGDWWMQPETYSLKYEDLVDNPIQELNLLFDGVAPPRCSSVSQVVDGCRIDLLRAAAGNYHFWKGRPGLWRELLPKNEALELAAVFPSLLGQLGYSCDYDRALDSLTADRNWTRFVGQELIDMTSRHTQWQDMQRAGWEARIQQEVAAAQVAREERDTAQQNVSELEKKLLNAEQTRLHLEQENCKKFPPEKLQQLLSDGAARILQLRSMFRTHGP